MVTERIFGTDGIRGIAGEGVLALSSVRRLGRIIGATVRGSLGDGGSPRACVGRDTRPSGKSLLGALLEGLTEVGVDVLDVGILPTPGVAHLTVEYGCQAGVVLSASHNPAAYNGLKVLGSRGEKIPDEVEDEIERLYRSDEPDPQAARRGEVIPAPEAADRYQEHLQGAWPDGSLAGMRLAMDCADGATSRVAPRIFRQLGADVEVTRDVVDGSKINQGCGPLHLENVQAFAREVGADVGLSFDGDGDRLMIVDDLGEFRDGDHILAVCARDLHRQGALSGKAVVGTVMSNVGLERSLEEIGARLVRARVGDRWVLEEMQTGGHVLGGEPSGHVIFLPLSAAGDGILTALRVLRIVRESRTPLSELSRCLRKAPQVVVNVRVVRKRPLEELEEVQEQIRSAEERLGREGRVLVRYSGTEPLVRVMVEGPDGEAVGAMARAIAGAFPGSEGR